MEALEAKEEILEVNVDPIEFLTINHEAMDSPVIDHSIEEIYVKEEPSDSYLKDDAIATYTSDYDNLVKHELKKSGDIDRLDFDPELELPSISRQKIPSELNKSKDQWPLAYFTKNDEETQSEDIKEEDPYNNWDYDTIVSESGVNRILIKQIPQLNQNLRIHECMICNKSFKHISHLYHHTRSVHEKLRPHKCDECNRAFSRKTHLTNHILSVHEKIKPHKCEECESFFSQKAHLLHHILSVHKKIKTHTCGDCDSAFSHKSHLLHHIQSIHEKIKPHKCDECDGAFSRKSYLSHHILTVHRKIKPYKCSVCDAGFSHRSVLCHHILAVHQNKKAHECKDCAKGYSQKSHLSRHILSAHKKLLL